MIMVLQVLAASGLEDPNSGSGEILCRFGGQFPRKISGFVLSIFD